MSGLEDLRETIATSDPRMLAAVTESLSRLGELTVLQRFHRGAGRRDWFIVRSELEIANVFARGRPHDAFSVFAAPQFEVRGPADDALSRLLLDLLHGIAPHTDELLVALVVSDQPLLKDCEGFGHHDSADLLEWLARNRGADVVAGHHPPLLSKDAREVITAVVPDKMGRIGPGVY